MSQQERDEAKKLSTDLKARIKNNTLTAQDRDHLHELVERAGQAAETLYESAVLGW
jgi:hypothetical protein